MLKHILIAIMILVTLSGALAETAVPGPFQVTQISSQEQQGALFTFIQGQVDSDYRELYRFDGKNSFPDYIGEECRIGEYIVPVRASYWIGATWHRVYADDYLKSSSSDLLPHYLYKNSAWFLADEQALPYDGYYCKEAVAAPPAPDSNGQFMGALSFDPVVSGGDSVTIEGKYFVTDSGPFILEASIDPSSRTTLAVVESSSSACDGSLYFSGSRINGIAGQTYTFRYTVRAPTTEGRYKVSVQAWTDCYDDGGDFIDRALSEIEVRSAQCDLTSVISDIGEAFFKIDNFRWSFDTPIANAIIDSYQCTTGELSNYCGTTDSDGDTIPDGCDYCPQDYGVPQDMNGCHPCFGMDPYSSLTKDCYEEYGEEFGIDPRLLDIVNPVVSTSKRCDESGIVVTPTSDTTGDVDEYGGTAKVIITETREFGDKETRSVSCTDADAGETAVCVQSADNPDFAQCESINLDDITNLETSDNQVCVNGDFDCVDSKEYVCFDNEWIDAQSACGTQDQTCEGGRDCVDGDPAVYPENPECYTDDDCSGYCQSGICRDPADWCTLDSDCDAGEDCLAGFCTMPLIDRGCLSDEECTEDASCVQGYCIEDVYFENATETSCDEDTYAVCNTGGSVITALCINGEKLVSTGNTCESGNAGDNPWNKITGAAGDITATLGLNTEQDPLTYIGVGVIILAAAGFMYFNFSKKPKRRRKR